MQERKNAEKTSRSSGTQRNEALFVNSDKEAIIADKFVSSRKPYTKYLRKLCTKKKERWYKKCYLRSESRRNADAQLLRSNNFTNEIDARTNPTTEWKVKERKNIPVATEIKVATWNVRTLRLLEHRKLVSDDLRKRSVLIAALQECR